MNIIEQVARMLDAEGAYGDFQGSPESAVAYVRSRQNYFRAHYECKAIELLKLMLTYKPEDVRAALIEFEKDGWRKLGVPLDKLPDADKIIFAKYS